MVWMNAQVDVQAKERVLFIIYPAENIIQLVNENDSELYDKLIPPPR